MEIYFGMRLDNIYICAKKYKVRYFIIMFFFLAHNIYAKEETIKYGKFTDAEIAMKACSMDSAAGAVVLSEIGSIRYELREYGFLVIYSKKFRIKIFDKNANVIKATRAVTCGEFQIALNSGDIYIPKIVNNALSTLSVLDLAY